VFRILDGKRFVVPGDWATVDVDGTVQLLGRGSGCINTGGEKVFPEEVENQLKVHTAVYDAVVLGISDIRFGQSVVAIIEMKKNQSASAADLIAFVKSRLSSYKAPRHILFAPIKRGPNAKPDLPSLQAFANEQLATHLKETS
jgi:acyl-CoA synthetase (AMP-forming)/AMP-acid ligase II